MDFPRETTFCITKNDSYFFQIFALRNELPQYRYFINRKKDSAK